MQDSTSLSLVFIIKHYIIAPDVVPECEAPLALYSIQNFVNVMIIICLKAIYICLDGVTLCKNITLYINTSLINPFELLLNVTMLSSLLLKSPCFVINLQYFVCFVSLMQFCRLFSYLRTILYHFEKSAEARKLCK